MSSAVCTHCGCSEIDKDATRGDAVCTNCGSVLEDQIIVSEVQFQESSAGGSSVIGQYVSSEGMKSHSLGSGFHHGVGKESRQITLQNGKSRIQRLGVQLKLNQHCIDTAFNFFKMAVNRRLTRGRKTMHVIAACVYIVCRTEGTAHMLIDFSDILQIDVYSLGRTYFQLSKDLHINIPALDPCLYIERFAHKLEFAEKTREVCNMALRLVQRMKRDWMAQGRRPSGLCGAALLVAARVHDFSRTIKDIICVVKIGEGTIRKRLQEFEATPSSLLTIDEFQKIDLEEEMDPPSFTEGKKRAKLHQFLDESTLTNEIAGLEEEIEKALDDANDKKFKRFKAFMSPGVSSDDVSVTGSTQASAAEDESAKLSSFLAKETLQEVLSESEVDPALLDKLGDTISPDHCSQQLPDILTDSELNTSQATDDGSVTLNLKDERDQEAAAAAAAKFGPRPTAASLGLTESIEDCMKVAVKMDAVENEDGELDLTDIDDDELDKFILNPDEVRVKTAMWMKANYDYLKEQKEKRERIEREEAELLAKPELAKKKRKQPRKKHPKIEAQTAGEAIEKMLQEKKISSKINYDVLKDLKRAHHEPGQMLSIDIVGPALGTGPVQVTPVSLCSPLGKRFRKPSMSVDSKTTNTQMPHEKKPKIEKQDEDVKPIIIETGPVVYDPEDEPEEEEDLEEEEEHVSAAQLMGHTGLEEEQDEAYYEVD